MDFLPVVGQIPPFAKVAAMVASESVLTEILHIWVYVSSTWSTLDSSKKTLHSRIKYVIAEFLLQLTRSIFGFNNLVFWIKAKSTQTQPKIGWN